MEKNIPIPIGRGEQIGLEKKLEKLEDTAAMLEEVTARMLSMREEIGKEYQEEMAKPEGERSRTVLDRVSAELEENSALFSRVAPVYENLQSTMEYIDKRQKELEERKNKEGY